ncbi:hypothetical protein KAR91_13970 [Candidatus Pacearchaeota archaeon]|nr:hypothetical protein [Candidatus Pacearchaeota archaeon]
MSQATDKYVNADYQRAVGELVDREVCYCASAAITALIANEPDTDDAMLLLGRPTYAAEYLCPDCDNLWWGEHETKEPLDIAYCKKCTSLAQQVDGDESQEEVFEYWLVTPYFGRKLREHGEIVVNNFHALCVWGRQTTGQAILLDSVICDIYDEIHN